MVVFVQKLSRRTQCASCCHHWTKEGGMKEREGERGEGEINATGGKEERRK